MPTGTLDIVAALGGISIIRTISETGDNVNVYGDSSELIALDAGKAASGWVKTDANTADCNLAGGHGYANGKMDVFWDDGRRYDVDGAVTSNAIALTGGTGDDFPANATTNMVVCTPQEVNVFIDGDAVTMLVIDSTKRAHLYGEDASAAAVGGIEVPVGDEPYTFYQSSGVTQPLTGNPVTKAWISNGETTAGVFTMMVLQDSTP